MSSPLNKIIIGVCFGVFAVAASAISSPDQSTSFLVREIKINKRQLLLNGVPFIMKGICYNPVRKGKTHLNGLLLMNPTSADLATIERDFQMMVAAGINTIRTYRVVTNPAILALLKQYQLRTIVPICANYESSLDTDAIIHNIELLKKEPSTLIWEIGNEWNLNYFYTRNFKTPSHLNGAELSNQQCLELVQNITNLIRAHDDTHPISTDVIYAPAVAYSNYPSCVDLYGINAYHGLDFGPNFYQLNQLIGDKPFYIGECGADAWNTPPLDPNGEQGDGVYDEVSQDVAIGCLINLMQQHLSAKDPNHILIGGCIFEWCDEWSDLGVHTIKGNRGPSDGSGPYPDKVYNDEWFGIVDIDRNPRPAYHTMRRLYENTR